MKKLLPLFILLSLVGCKESCDAPGSVASLVSNAVASSWQCQNPTQVLSDVSNVCAKLGFCTVPPSGTKGGMIANVACPLVVGELQNLAASKVPANWQCNPSLVGENFAMALTALCEQLPF